MAFTFQCIGGFETSHLEAVLSSKQCSSCEVMLQNSCARIEHSCLHGAQMKVVVCQLTITLNYCKNVLLECFRTILIGKQLQRNSRGDLMAVVAVCYGSVTLGGDDIGHAVAENTYLLYKFAGQKYPSLHHLSCTFPYAYGEGYVDSIAVGTPLIFNCRNFTGAPALVAPVVPTPLKYATGMSS